MDTDDETRRRPIAIRSGFCSCLASEANFQNEDALRGVSANVEGRIRDNIEDFEGVGGGVLGRDGKFSEGWSENALKATIFVRKAGRDVLARLWLRSGRAHIKTAGGLRNALGKWIASILCANLRVLLPVYLDSLNWENNQVRAAMQSSLNRHGNNACHTVTGRSYAAQYSRTPRPLSAAR
jgi:hypothetical protein